MLTLNNILLNDEDVIVIYFTYEGDSVEFDGQIKLTKEQFCTSYQNGDEYLYGFVEDTLQRELISWIVN